MQIILTEDEYHELKTAAEIERAKNKLDRTEYLDELTSFLSTELQPRVRQGDMFGVCSNYVRLSDLLEVLSKARFKFVLGETPVK